MWRFSDDPSRRGLLRGLLSLPAATLLAGRRSRAAAAPSVVVVGGGPAGISAAVELAERGARVTLVEAGAWVGGKVQGWQEEVDGRPVDVEHGIHGWWHQYVHFRELLARHGLADALRPFRHREHALFLEREGEARELRSWFQRVDAIQQASGRRGPGFLRRYGQGIRWLRESTVDGLRAELSGRSLADLLAGPDRPLTVYTSFARVMAWSMYFVDPAEVSASEVMLGERFYFTGTPRNDEVSWLSGNPDTQIWRPLAQVIRDRGGTVRLDSPVTSLLVEEGRVVGVRVGGPAERRRVEEPGPRWQAVGAGVVARRGPDGPEALSLRCTHQGCPVSPAPDGGFACPCHGGRYDDAGRVTAGPPPAPLARLPVAEVDGGLEITVPATQVELRADHVILAVDAPAAAALAGDLLPDLRGLRGTREVVGRFWLDRDVHRRRRPAVMVDHLPHASNVFLVHRLQDEAAAWAAETGGSVVEVQAYRDLPADLRGDALLDRVHADLLALYPELDGATVLHRHLTDGGRFTWFFPGWERHAPPVDPGVPGLLLAGDFIDVDRNCQFMERAVYTGRLAANVVLEGAGLSPAPVLPPRGRG